MPRGYRHISRVEQPVEKKKSKKKWKASTKLSAEALSLFRSHEKEIVAKYNKGMSCNSLSRWLHENRDLKMSISRLQLFLGILDKEGKVLKRSQAPRYKGKKVKPK